MGLKHPSPQHPDSAPARAGSCHLLPGPGCIFLVGYRIALALGVPRATQCPFPIVMLGLGGVQQLLPWQPSVISVCLYPVLWGSLCFLVSPHVLEWGQDFKIISFCFPGPQQWKDPIGPTVALRL